MCEIWSWIYDPFVNYVNDCLPYFFSSAKLFFIHIFFFLFMTFTSFSFCFSYFFPFCFTFFLFPLLFFPVGALCSLSFPSYFFSILISFSLYSLWSSNPFVFLFFPFLSFFHLFTLHSFPFFYLSFLYHIHFSPIFIFFLSFPSLIFLYFFLYISHFSSLYRTISNSLLLLAFSSIFPCCCHSLLT